MKHMVSRLVVRDEVVVGKVAPLVPFGDDLADDQIERLVVDVAEMLGSIETQVLSGEHANLSDCAKQLQITCDGAGLLMLARIAVDLQVCLSKSDHVALFAVTERAMRVGEASLAAAIDSACLNC